jgi:hypothetical protein
MDHRNLIHNPATHSTAHDLVKAKEKIDADKRRADLDRMRAKVTSLKQAPVLGETAKLHTHSLGGLHSHAVVVVKFLHRDKSVHTWAICELSVDTDGLTLILPCPACLFRHHRALAESHLTMRSWHRRFSLDSHGQGEIWVNPKNPAEVVTLAGAIETHEVQTCPTCSFKFEIEKSRDPAERGLSVLREA